MRLEHFKSYTQIHTWTGIISGLFLFICFVAGALTMFDKPLNQWALQHKSMLPPVELNNYDKLIQKVLHTYPEAQANMTVSLPPALPQSAPISWTIEDKDTHKKTVWHASLNENEELIVENFSVSNIGDFMDQLHRTAGIPGGEGHDAIGTYVMGIVSAFYFLAIVSGLIIFLPSWLKDLFTIRRGKNRKRFWIDFHNILGISALPFHIIIALTTIVFAYHDLFYVSLKGMVYKDTPMFDRPSVSENKNLSDLASISLITASINEIEPELETAVLNYRALNTPRASLLIGGKMEGHWVRGPYYAFATSNPYTAIPEYTVMLPSQDSLIAKFVNGFFTLHFGGFGGGMIRWIYFGLGISGALLFLSGNILWIEKRRKRQKQNNAPPKQLKSTVVMARLTVGVSLGTLIGIAFTFLSARWIPHHEFDIQWWQKLSYYFGFFCCIFWAFLQAPLVAAKQQLIALCILTTVLAVSTFSDLSLQTMDTRNIAFTLTVLVLASGLFLTLNWLKRRASLMEENSVWL